MDQQKEDTELMQVYEWVDNVPLSRPKKNMARDFSDGVLMAELIKNHIPKLVEIHNYPSSSSSTQKTYNWATLNHKVFKKLGFQITKQEIQDIINCKPFIIENILKKVYRSIQNYNENQSNQTRNEGLSGDYKLDLSNNDQLNINNSSPYYEDSNYKNMSDNQLRRELEDKDLKIEELKNIVEILEMKLKNSDDIQIALEKRIKELSNIVREKGLK